MGGEDKKENGQWCVQKRVYIHFRRQSVLTQRYQRGIPGDRQTVVFHRICRHNDFRLTWLAAQKNPHSIITHSYAQEFKYSSYTLGIKNKHALIITVNYKSSLKKTFVPTTAKSLAEKERERGSSTNSMFPASTTETDPECLFLNKQMLLFLLQSLFFLS